MSSDAPVSTLRFALRSANAFIVEALTAVRGERDFTDALILTTLVQSAAASLAGAPDLQRRFGVLDAPPPPELRRPISVNAVAASLGLPFETVRRRMKRLSGEGVCEVTAEGMKLSDAMLESAEHRLAVERCYELTRSLYARLKRAGCLELMSLPPPAAAWTDAAPPTRIVWRAAADYLLRMMEHLMPNVAGLTRAFIVLSVVRANTESLPDLMRGGDGTGPDDFVPDAYRKPARASEVAAQLGLPHETVRRNLAALVEDGRCVRVRDGFIVPAAVLARPKVQGAGAANFRDLSRMLHDLGQAGVLALWNEELAAPQAA